MKGLKDFRRSLNKDRASRGAAPTTYTGVRSATSATKQPPSKVIRATRDYRARQPNELSFSKGDFFHVLNDSTHPEWFEAVNPITNARGHVPAAYFDVLTKTARPGGPSMSGPGSASSDPMAGPTSPGVGTDSGDSGLSAHLGSAKGAGGLYAVVKYDFEAERPDELDSKAGDSIIVIAQSNFEWFVASPIGKLGGPGLIPVAFVEIRDMVTGQSVENVQELIRNGTIPKVEEWKKMKADYTKNTIPLGRFDFAGQQGPPSLPGSPFDGTPGGDGAGLGPNGMGPGGMGGMFMGGAGPSGQFNQGPSDMMIPPGMEPYQRGDQPLPSLPGGEEVELPPGMAPGEPLPCGIIESARVDSFHFEQGDYWFRVQATHIAGPSPAPPDVLRAPTGEVRELILYRLYEDFYEFQLALLEHFPAEAGRETGPNGQPNERILPLMPGPIDEVDDVITSQRRADLDTYIQELCALPEHIRRSELLRVFFEPRPGDHCTRLPLQPGSEGANGSTITRTSAGTGTGDRLAAAAGGDVFSLAPSDGFIKIKIFNRASDDLVAIRVPPDVTFSGLMTKVRERLGQEISVMRYRDESGMMRLSDDDDLSEWVASGQKLTLWADVR
ncbi:unnamed protein product [Tilletia controversa]|nr:unnamed protein product [Tilletia controversa]